MCVSPDELCFAEWKDLVGPEVLGAPPSGVYAVVAHLALRLATGSTVSLQK